MVVSTLIGVTDDLITYQINFLFLIFGSINNMDHIATPVLYLQIIPDGLPTIDHIANYLDSSDNSHPLATIRQTLHIAIGLSNGTFFQLTDIQMDLFCYFSSH